jgi:hypothetical protein
MLFYPRNTENNLVISDLYYIWVNFFRMFSDCYSYKNNLVLDYFFVMFDCYPIDNNK